MKLSKRLKSIVNLIPVGSKVADIGTDHGFIPVFLALNGISDYVVASDLRIDSLNKAIKEIEKHKLNAYIKPRLGSGLSVLNPEEVDVAIIAGMGGILISNILENDEEIAKTIKRFIFQPMKASDYLRKYLIKNGYIIVDEELVKEQNKYYEIIVAEHGTQIYSDEIYYEIGKKLVEKRNPLLHEFLKYKIDKMRKIINEMLTKKKNDNKRYKELLSKLKRYEVFLNEFEMSDYSRNDG